MRFYQQLKNIYHWLQAQAWRVRYGRPERRLQLFGVTGTNGKTTTSIVLASILRAAYGRQKVGLLSTEFFWVGDRETPNATHMTSTNAKVVYRYLRDMAEAGVTHAVVEMTSHALDQNRLAGLRLSGAIILNIAHEHLDYHRTMEAYTAAKMRIVDYLSPNGILVYKADDEWVQKGLRRIQNTKSKIQNSAPFTSAEAHTVTTPLPGDFNKENVLAAKLLAAAVGIADEAIARGVAAVTHIPGRVEWIALPNGARAVVDFALTPYSYEKLFAYLRGETPGRLVAVFGAAGRRDTKKRPLITHAVARYADEIILTQDEPYDDPEEDIYRDLEEGLRGAAIAWRRIPDRRAAIAAALQQTKQGDVVAVVGMGNYNVRMVGSQKIPWNDKHVILEIAQRLQ